MNIAYHTGLQGDRVTVGTYDTLTHSDIIIPLGTPTEHITLFVTNLDNEMDLSVPQKPPPGYYSPPAPQLLPPHHPLHQATSVADSIDSQSTGMASLASSHYPNPIPIPLHTPSPLAHSIAQSDPIMDYWSRYATHEMKAKWRAAVDSKGYEVRKLVDGVIAAQDCLRAHPDLDTGKPLRLSNLYMGLRGCAANTAGTHIEMARLFYGLYNIEGSAELFPHLHQLYRSVHDVKDLEKGHADYTAKVMKVTQSKAFKYLKVCERTGREPGADL